MDIWDLPGLRIGDLGAYRYFILQLTPRDSDEDGRTILWAVRYDNVRSTDRVTHAQIEKEFVDAYGAHMFHDVIDHGHIVITPTYINVFGDDEAYNTESGRPSVKRCLEGKFPNRTIQLE